MKKDSANVKLPMCGTLAFLRLSLVEGFHPAFVQRIWIICWKFYCMIVGIDELLRMSTGYNIFGVKSATRLKTRWLFVLFLFLMSSLYSCNITSEVIFHWWVQYSNTGRYSKRTDYFSLTHFLLCLGLWLCCDVTDVCWRDWNKGNSASFYFRIF